MDDRALWWRWGEGMPTMVATTAVLATGFVAGFAR